MAHKPTIQKPREWRITLLRAKGQYLGHVMAADEKAAIQAAIAEFKIDKAHQDRLIAEPVE